MKAAVLIVNWNSWKDTIECLESVYRSEYPDLRVVVCDNASTDASLEQLRGWASAFEAAGRPLQVAEYSRSQIERRECRDAATVDLVLIQTGTNLGFAGGNNVGLEYVLANPDIEWVWLLNPDTAVAAPALGAMVALAQTDPRIGMVGSKVLFYDEPETIQAIGGGRVIPWQGMTRFLGAGQRDVGQWDAPLQPDYITGCSMLVRVETIRSIGLMDERYFLYGEEVDWCLRARRDDWLLMYCPGSVVRHKEGTTVGRKNARSDYYSVRSSLLLTDKFHPRLLPVALAHSMFRCLLSKVVRLHFDRVGPTVKAYRDFFAMRSSATADVAIPARLGDLPAVGKGLS